MVKLILTTFPVAFIFILFLLFPATAQPTEATPLRDISQPLPIPQPLDPSKLPLDDLIREAKKLDVNQFPLIPPQIPFLGSDENINFHLRLSNGSKTVFGIKLRDRRITEITDQIDDWTLRVEVREETIERMAASGEPLPELREALKNKEIKIQGRTFTKKVKATFLKIGLRLSGLFSG